MRKILLFVAWTWVAIPLGWGVFQSGKRSMPLFFEGSAEKKLEVQEEVETGGD